MFCRVCRKTIFKSKNGVLTCFVTATKCDKRDKVRQTKKGGLSQKFFEMPLLRALLLLVQKKATTYAVTKFAMFIYENYFFTSLEPLTVKESLPAPPKTAALFTAMLNVSASAEAVKVFFDILPVSLTV